ncbi:MAG: M14 family metallocarboxypeptidase [Clostridia bacterium]|nr:M14 family metallocarboxypeptidase [Clostridia bacterium]
MKYEQELTYEALMEKLIFLSKKYEFLKLSYIGTSILSRPIPMITIGESDAKKSVLYVSTHHASENICTCTLVDFIEEYAKMYEDKRSVFGINLSVLYKMRRIHIIPMLNPDGVSYRLEGINDSNPLKERVEKLSNGCDFSHWNANARGVDLNHNYDAYFYDYKEIEKERGICEGASKYSGESPESEPETAALCRFIRYNIDTLCGILTLHSQGEEIYYKSNGTVSPKSELIAKTLSTMTDYKLAQAEDTASYGGLTDWFIKEFSKPSFTLECGKGENPLDIKNAPAIYARIRKALFNFPILF